jgi:hypothetical protein
MTEKKRDQVWAKVDVDFLDGSDRRMLGPERLTPNDRCVYLGLWGLARHYRRATLPSPLDANHPGIVADAIRVQRRHVTRAVPKLLTNGLLLAHSWQSAGHLTLAGYEVMHNRQSDGGVKRVRDRDREELEIKKKNEAASPRSSEKSNDCEKEYNWTGLLIGKIRASWILNFGKSQHPRLDWLRERCEALDVAPWWVLKYAKEHCAEKPIEYVSWILKNGNTERTWPDESATSYQRWEEDAIAEAKRKT